MARLGAGDLAEVRETHERYRPRVRPATSRRTGPTVDQQMELAAAPDPSGEPPKENWVSMEQALRAAREIRSDLPRRTDFTVVSNYGTGGDPDARGRRDHDMPSATITGKVSRNRVVHKGTDEDFAGDLGRFGSAEAGVLQTFPVRYPWKGKDVAQQIGNAVPPLLALHVLRHVLEPDLGAEEAEARLEQAEVRLRNWAKPTRPTKALDHRGLKGHPLTGR